MLVAYQEGIKNALYGVKWILSISEQKLKCMTTFQ